MKPRQCRFCELLVSQIDGQFEKHATYCGSKTKECEICGGTVTARELENHVATGECEIVIAAKEAQERETARKIAQEKQRQDAKTGSKRKATSEVEVPCGKTISRKDVLNAERQRQLETE